MAPGTISFLCQSLHLLFREQKLSLWTLPASRSCWASEPVCRFNFPGLAVHPAPEVIITRSMQGPYQEEWIPGSTGGTHHWLNVNGAWLLSGGQQDRAGGPRSPVLREAAHPPAASLPGAPAPPILSTLARPQPDPDAPQPPHLPAGEHPVRPSSESFGEITVEDCFSGTPFFRNNLLIWGEGWCFTHLFFHQHSSRA